MAKAIQNLAARTRFVLLSDPCNAETLGDYNPLSGIMDYVHIVKSIILFKEL